MMGSRHSKPGTCANPSKWSILALSAIRSAGVWAILRLTGCSPTMDAAVPLGAPTAVPNPRYRPGAETEGVCALLASDALVLGAACPFMVLGGWLFSTSFSVATASASLPAERARIATCMTVLYYSVIVAATALSTVL